MSAAWGLYKLIVSRFIVLCAGADHSDESPTLVEFQHDIITMLLNNVQDAMAPYGTLSFPTPPGIKVLEDEVGPSVPLVKGIIDIRDHSTDFETSSHAFVSPHVPVDVCNTMSMWVSAPCDGSGGRLLTKGYLPEFSSAETRGKAVRFEPANAWDTAEKYNVDVDGSIVTSKGTGHSHILSNYCVSSGKASWEFKLVKDVSGNEMSCFGAATKPCSSEKYDSNSSMYMLRG